MSSSDIISNSSNEVFASASTNSDVQCVDFSILEDSALEGNQTFTVTLTTSDPDVMLGNGMTAITIIDNDSQ